MIKQLFPWILIGTNAWGAAFHLSVGGGTGAGSYPVGSMVDVDAAPAPEGQVFSKWVGGRGCVEDIYSLSTTVLMPDFDLSISAVYTSRASCGIEDIDRIRQDVKDNPVTHTGNMASRRAALYRWWRLLWHQGYDMTAFDKTAEALIYRDNEDAWAIKAVTRGYALLEGIQTNGVPIEQVTGTPEPSTSKTDWPVYHGTNSHQTGFSRDRGPSRGRLAWRRPVGHDWHATPVISDRRVYAAGAGSDVIGYCLDEITGDVLWNTRQFGLNFYTTTGTKWTPAVSSDRVMLWTGYWQPSRMFIVDKRTGAEVLSLGAGDIDGGDPAELVVYRRMGQLVILADARTGQGVWQFDAGGLLAGDPVLSDEMVYAARLSGQVYQLSRSQPTPTWSRTINAGLRGRPSIGRGRVYVGDVNRTLHALDDSNGEILWSYQASEVENKAYQFFSGAVESGGRVYVGAASRYLYCLDSTTGSLIWKHSVGDWVRSKPLVLGRTIYVATLDSRIHAVQDEGNAASLQWQRTVGEHGFAADLVGNENGILASGRDVVLYSISPTTGYIQWRHGLLDQAWIKGRPHAAEVIGGQYMSSPTIVDGRAYIGGPDGFARAFDADTGELLWRYETSGQIKATLTVADNMVFIPQVSGHDDFHAVDRVTGEPVWTSDEFGWVFPGVGHAPAYETDGDPSNDRNRIYIAAMSGKVFGVDAGSGAVDWTSTASVGCNGLFPHPVTDATRFYSGGHDGYYRAWNQDDGHVEWSTRMSSGSGGNPDSAGMVMWKDRLYVQKRGRSIAALDPSDGAVDWEWTAPVGFLQNGTVAAFDDKIFGSAICGAVELPYRSTVYAFDDVDRGGGPLWSYSAGGGGGGLTGPVATPGKLIFGSTAGVFMTCLDPEDGDLKWRCYTGGAMEEAVPGIYDDKVFFLSRNGYFNAVE
jgi:outer membrane protein assembly factor BamB